MQKPKNKYFTPEEYLALEEKSEYKSEYYQGKIFVFSANSLNHNTVLGNISANLHQNYNNHNCRVFSSDLRLWIESKELFTYPDIMLLCDKPKFYSNRDDTIINPIIIFEVLSESTKNYDRGEKFVFYRSIPTFKEYILVDQYSIHIEQYNISQEGKWQLTEYNDVKERLTLSAIDFQLPLETIYANVVFEDKTT